MILGERANGARVEVAYDRALLSLLQLLEPIARSRSVRYFYNVLLHFEYDCSLLGSNGGLIVGD